ncbi:MAG: methyltransferase [Candidatus Methanomethylophilaceae archaeon]|nr:methyltransferase [Candidatus Methanomethylophilaceae archaeon]
MEFRPDIDIRERDDVYPPSDDSILLIESLQIRPGERILEIGCGSGVVSIHCASNGCSVTAVDINPSAVECTRENAELNGVPMDVRQSDLFENVPERFDTIVFNLPYLPVIDEGELAKAWSGGEDGMGPLPRLMEEANGHLYENGRVVVVVSSLMDQNKLNALLSKYEVEKMGEAPLFFERLEVLEIIP